MASITLHPVNRKFRAFVSIRRLSVLVKIPIFAIFAIKVPRQQFPSIPLKSPPARRAAEHHANSLATKFNKKQWIRFPLWLGLMRWGMFLLYGLAVVSFCDTWPAMTYENSGVGIPRLLDRAKDLSDRPYLKEKIQHQALLSFHWAGTSTGER